MAAEEKTEATTSVSAAPPSGGSRLVTVLTLVNVAATLAMAAVLFVSFQRDMKQPSITDIAAHDSGHGGDAKEGAPGGAAKPGEGKEGAPKKGPDFGKMVTLEQFTVNLSTPGSVNPKFVRVNISLEVPNDDAEAEVTSKMPQVRNAIIDLFNSKRSSDLAGAEGREYLKEEIKNALNAFMVTGKIKGVFFTNFAMTS